MKKYAKDKNSFYNSLFNTRLHYVVRHCCLREHSGPWASCLVLFCQGNVNVIAFSLWYKVIINLQTCLFYHNHLNVTKKLRSLIHFNHIFLPIVKFTYTALLQEHHVNRWQNRLYLIIGHVRRRLNAIPTSITKS